MNGDEPAILCDLVRRNGKFVCTRCNQGRLPGSLPLPIYRVCRTIEVRPSRRRKPPKLVYNDLAATGPCRNRGETIAIESCRIGCRRDQPIETFRCLPDAGCPGPAPIVSERQWSHAQTLNRRREVCSACDRYQPANRLISIEG